VGDSANDNSLIINGVYRVPALPYHWVIKTGDGQFHLVPAKFGGWLDRVPYSDTYGLRRVSMSIAHEVVQVLAAGR
jgi:hypothetical protein